ncbi:MAG: hypothetical protein ABR95_00350 [Sphingobacteriales bacterium BACL12 MAG-120813-bin55]|nr:MAG: hypothetical protein ABR94_03485 [Sphingobacteriales bacterium BACL12 MAG-120802-bin5]KRP07005.1 MAG: hypothetical protein ABR95_00350 [Sphingobacteriales bacterium BACL12 MAG-120813-bin55]
MVIAQQISNNSNAFGPVTIAAADSFNKPVIQAIPDIDTANQVMTDKLKAPDTFPRLPSLFFNAYLTTGLRSNLEFALSYQLSLGYQHNRWVGVGAYYTTLVWIDYTVEAFRSLGISYRMVPNKHLITAFKIGLITNYYTDNDWYCENEFISGFDVYFGPEIGWRFGKSFTIGIGYYNSPAISLKIGKYYELPDGEILCINPIVKNIMIHSFLVNIGLNFDIFINNI